MLVPAAGSAVEQALLQADGADDPALPAVRTVHSLVGQPFNLSLEVGRGTGQLYWESSAPYLHQVGVEGNRLHLPDREQGNLNIEFQSDLIGIFSLR